MISTPNSNIPKRTPWEHLGHDGDDWHAFVRAAAEVADDLTPQLERVAELEALTDALPLELRRKFDGPVLSAIVAVFDDAVLLGYALARTWPATPEEVTDWPRRALAYAGLDDGDDSGPDNPDTD